MIIEISIVTDVINSHGPLPGSLAGQAGAMVEFTGLVRGDEKGQAISALEYEAYQPMAEQTLRTIIGELGQRHPCLFIRVIHRIGIVPVGEAAIYVVAYAAHRGAALHMVEDFMVRLKQDVPIWKTGALNQAGNPLPISP